MKTTQILFVFGLAFGVMLETSIGSVTQEDLRQLGGGPNITSNQLSVSQQSQSVANNVYLGNGVPNPVWSNPNVGQQQMPILNNGFNYGGPAQAPFQYQPANFQSQVQPSMNNGVNRMYSPGFGAMPSQPMPFAQNNGMFGGPGFMPGMMGSPFMGSGMGMMGMPGQLPMGLPMSHGMMGMPGPMPMGLPLSHGMMPPVGFMPGMPFPSPMGGFGMNPALSANPFQMYGGPAGFNPMFGGMGMFGGGMGAANPLMMPLQGMSQYLAGYNPGYSSHEIKELSRKLNKYRKEYLNTLEQQPVDLTRQSE